MSILDTTLEKLKKSGELAIFMRENQSDSGYWGILIDYSKDFLFLSLVDMDGLSDGVVIFERSQLTRIRWQTSKIEAVSMLMKKKKAKHHDVFTSLNSTREILENTQKSFGYIGFLIENLDDDALVIGEIENIDDLYVIVSEYANKDHVEFKPSKVLCAIDDISLIEVGSTYCEDIRYINEKSD